MKIDKNKINCDTCLRQAATGAIWFLVIMGIVILCSVRIPDKIANNIQIAILGALIITAWITLNGQKKNREDFEKGLEEERKKFESKEYLEKAIYFAEKAYEILCKEDGKATNNRVAWVSAARLIGRSLELQGLISLPAHQKIFETERDLQRHNWAKLLNLDKNGFDLGFFVGGNFSSYVSGHDSHLQNNDGDFCIPEKALAAVIRFASFPEGYADNISSVESFTSRELLNHHTFEHIGLVNYVYFTRNFRIIEGEIYPRNNEGNPGPIIPAALTNSLNKIVSNEVVATFSSTEQESA